MYLVFSNKCGGFITANDRNDSAVSGAVCCAEEAEAGCWLLGVPAAFPHLTLYRGGPRTP